MELRSKKFRVRVFNFEIMEELNSFVCFNLGIIGIVRHTCVYWYKCCKYLNQNYNQNLGIIYGYTLTKTCEPSRKKELLACHGCHREEGIIYSCRLFLTTYKDNVKNSFYFLFLIYDNKKYFSVTVSYKRLFYSNYL